MNTIMRSLMILLTVAIATTCALRAQTTPHSTTDPKMKPDLVINQALIAVHVYSTNSTIDIPIKNIGLVSCKVPCYQVTFYDVAGMAYNVPMIVDQANTQPIAPGGTGIFTIMIPAKLYGKAFRAKIAADHCNQLAELSELNNGATYSYTP